jgi:protein-disulfide isomerase
MTTETDASGAGEPSIGGPSEPTPATSGGGRGVRGLLAPAVVLLVVAALAIAAMGGGGSDEPAAAPAADDAPADPAEDIADDLVVEPDPEAEAAQEQAQLDEEEARLQLAALANRDPDDPRALGDPDAPVVMIEWADFFCPFCGVFARDTEPVLIERYVEAGLLRIEWRDLPFQGEEALLAALGGQAAAEQDAFWAYHEALFAEDLRRGDPRFGRDFLLEVAADLDLDVAAFEAALDDEELLGRVQTDALVAQALNLTGTPAFLVEGRPVVGAQPLEVFVNLIENAIVEAGAELP